MKIRFFKGRIFVYRLKTCKTETIVSVTKLSASGVVSSRVSVPAECGARLYRYVWSNIIFPEHLELTVDEVCPSCE